MKPVKLYEEFISEALDLSEIEVGTELYFKDGEVWKVTKILGPASNPRSFLAKPHDEKTKKANTSIEIEMKLDFLKKELKFYSTDVEENMNEATTSWKRMMKGVKAGNTGPWSLVAIENYKVVAQNVDIRIMDIIPAHFEKMRKDYPKADIHIEDATGMVVWNESLNEAVFKYTEDDINMTAGFYGTLEQEYDEKKVQKMYLQAIEDLKKAYKTSEETAIQILDSREGRHFADFIVSKTTQPNIVDAMVAYFGSSAKLYNFIGSIKEGKIIEGTYNSKREIAIYDGAEGLTHIEKRGKGYYGYNDEFDFEATDKADLVKKLKSWKYKLISGSIDESVINEAKTLDRDEMMVHLEDKYKFSFIRTTEEFDGAEGGIWLSGENGESLGGKRIYNYYGEGSAYDLGVLKKYETAINKLGWYSEWYDTGTVMIWPE
jgi:hypothetical protein